MNFFLKILIICFVSSACIAQNNIDKTLKKFNRESVPYIQPEELVPQQNAIILDTREKSEYDVSHLKNAIWVGYKNFQLDSVIPKIKNKKSEIVVYCSIGVRSEDIGEKLMKAGYSDVKNLYGGIFEWKNKGYPVYDNQEKETEKIHAFSKHWGKLLFKGEKVYGDENGGKER
ncbi:MAG: rhodanese-like domain-containing protein [Maribacter sp.]|nr:rhodanese-like domain-containing protein [Maribacter sp.]